MQNEIGKRKMTIIKEIALKSDQFYDKAQNLGTIAARAIGDKHKSQMSNLENIALSTMKVSDVLDYIKKQTARSKEWQSDHFGNLLKSQIENEILYNRNEICETVEIDKSSVEAQQIYIALIREFVHQAAVHYEYTLIEMGG